MEAGQTVTLALRPAWFDSKAVHQLQAVNSTGPESRLLSGEKVVRVHHGLPTWGCVTGHGHPLQGSPAGSTPDSSTIFGRECKVVRAARFSIVAYRVRVPTRLPVMDRMRLGAATGFSPLLDGFESRTVYHLCLCGEIADAVGLEPTDESRAGASPARGTNFGSLPWRRT